MNIKLFTQPVFITFGIMVLFAVLYVFWTQGDKASTSSKNETNNSQNLIPTPTSPAFSPTGDYGYPGAVDFKSESLGIEFFYLPTQNGAEFKTLETGNKVYVYNTAMSSESGQFVEVFQKDPSETLEAAITKKFLSGKSEKECWVIDTTENYKYYPSHYHIAEITFPKPTGSQEPWFARSTNCSDFAQTNGVRYFLEDANHPNVFLYFDIGQYAIWTTETIPWQDTIRFLN